MSKHRPTEVEQDKQFHAESDLRTLRSAAEILQDKGRVSAARAIADTEIKAIKTVQSSLGKGLPKKGKA